MTSSYGLQGRVAVVTGASRGIGLAVAEGLVAAGAQVCVTGRDAEDVRRAAAKLGAVGIAGTVADPAHLRELTELAMTEFGRIDIVVNNAATNQPYGPLMDADPDLWREAFTVNVEAPLRLVQYAWRAWMSDHGGSVINICTEGATHVGPNVGAYGTSKAALLHLTRQLAGELAPRVRVNSVSPGLVRTEMARFVWEQAENELAAGLPWAASANRRTSPARWSGWPRTRRSGSRARTYWWTAEQGCARPTRQPRTPYTTAYARTHQDTAPHKARGPGAPIRGAGL